ncbi:MAG TPA: NADPH-dependent assimilatory sulfite reductase hemoprotein subunit [Acidimicrobiales bacterium]
MGSAVEGVKTASRQLRGTLATELASDSTEFSGEATTLLKFHGSYQQDDRDRRRALTAKRQPLAYSCMVRTSLPGGVLTADQWLAADDLAGAVADGTLRITTRQDLQFHFVHKGDLHALIHTLNEHLVTTLAACGDVVRNVMCCPADVPGRDQTTVLAAAQALSARFKPQGAAYYELWVDGERAVTAEVPEGVLDDAEPLYGDAYLPRKFKIGFAFPGDNCVDVYTNDVGVVPIERDGEAGYVVLIGGGLGQAHAREDDTYPRLASPLLWTTDADLAAVVEAIITIHRDFGNRDDRHRARLKYVVDERGLDWCRAEVERRVGHPLADPVELPPWLDSADHLGWWEDAHGVWVLGVPVPSGRVRGRQRDALRRVVETWRPEIRLTPRQDVLLTGFAVGDRDAVDAVLAGYGVAPADSLRPVERHAMACPALPTCGQALAEAERVLPRIVDDIHDVLDAVELGDLPLRVNVTGCPNGCARPYTSEVGIVGRTKSTYDLYVGGTVGGDRLNRRIAIGATLEEVPKLLAPLVEQYRVEARPGEGFGDFAHRAIPVDAPVWIAPPRRRRSGEAD